VSAEAGRPDPGSADDGLGRRLAGVTAARLLVVTALLGGTAFFYLREKLVHYSASTRVVLATIAVAYALSAIQAALLRRGEKRKVIAYAHIVMDQCLWTAIVYVTGGASSGATSFYGLTVLVGAVLTGVRGAAVAALTGFALYGLLCAAFLLHVIVPPSDQPAVTYAVSLTDMSYSLMVNALGITVVALLAGYLAERLRATGGALEVATKRYTEAERLAELGRIAAWLAHEIRNPLGSISGSVELLGDSPALSKEDRDLCAIVSREVTRLNDLVGDMLDLSKPRPPSAERVDVASLAREVVELAGRSSKVGAATVRYDGPADEPAYATCDGAQMRQVLWNLVRNAVQASPEGTEVSVKVEVEADRVRLAVDDHGPGIAGETKERIFDGFYTTRSHGAGIGLAVVKRIIDDHQKLGASIGVSNAPSGGARFQVTLRRDGAPRRSLAPRPA
jgi:signal transduction histidine kinase